MVIKVYVSGISGNHEIRKQQQRVLFVLSSLKLEFQEVDITEYENEEERNFMRTQCKLLNRPNALPPQIFNDTDYCGDYDDFEAANEEDRLMEFLRIGKCTSTANIKFSRAGDEDNGEVKISDCKGSSVSDVETGEREAVEA